MNCRLNHHLSAITDISFVYPDIKGKKKKRERKIGNFKMRLKIELRKKDLYLGKQRERCVNKVPKV